MILEKEFVFLKMTSNEIEKKKFISLIKATAVMRKKHFIRNLNLIDLNYHWKKMDWLDQCKVKQNVTTTKMYFFKNKSAKDKNIAILLFVSTFHNVARKLKTGWAARMVKPILKTRKVDDKC